VHLFEIKALGEGDVLLMTRLDRLARSTRDLLNTLDAIGKAESLWLLWLMMFMRLASGSASGDWQLYSRTQCFLGIAESRSGHKDVKNPAIRVALL
jgi:Resolvase, N terminal domain